MADISYTPTTWADGSEGGTPIDAAKLNNIESGISDAVAAIGPNDTTADGTLKAQIDALGESVNGLSIGGSFTYLQAGSGMNISRLQFNADPNDLYVRLFNSTDGGNTWTVHNLL